MENTAMTSKGNGKAARRPRAKAVKATPTVDLDAFRSNYLGAMQQLRGTFVDRDDAIRVMALAVLVGANYLLIGVHVTAKTALIRCFMRHFSDARFFTPGTCGSFTTLDELVGPPDIQAFQQGKWSRKTDGRLADCDFAFLDEVMKANDGAINSLLTLLNERELDGQPVALRSVGSATNWPEVKARSEKVEALFDRFLLRCRVDRVSDEAKLASLAQDATGEAPPTKAENYTPVTSFSLAELDAAGAAIRKVALSDVAAKKLANVVVRLRREGVDISERRMVQMVSIMKAAAWLRGSDTVDLGVFDVLVYGCWVDEPHIDIVEAVVDSLDQETVRECIRAIDKARQEFAGLAVLGRDQWLGKAPTVAKAMRVTAARVKTLAREQGLTERGRTKVREGLEAMRGEVLALDRQVKEELGLNLDSE